MTFDRDIALEALGAVLNAKVTSVQRQSHHTSRAAFSGGTAQQLSIKHFIPTLLDADETSQVSRSCFLRIQSVLQGGPQAASPPSMTQADTVRDKTYIIDENEFFAPEFNYDFTNLRDTETYYRGGEVYERPCGWFRYGLKVLDKYDGNTWLGTSYRSTQSVPGEWPVSFHGTSKQGAEGIIEGHYKPGPGQAYGRGIYSTPYVAEAVYYAKTFTSNKTGKTYKVILQNRINPKYRLKYNNDKYWLVPIPANISNQQEQEMVERAIRPYGLLLKQTDHCMRYGRGIYSTPYLAEAVHYAKTFTCNKMGKKYKVLLQNRINPEYRQKHRNDEKYWLIPTPAGISVEEEREMVKRAIRPYVLLLKEIKQ